MDYGGRLIKILIYPDQSGLNDFIKNTVVALEENQGVAVRGISLNHVELILNTYLRSQYDADYTIINWLENNMRGRFGRFSLWGAVKYFFLLLTFKCTCRKLIYVRHNIYPHGMTGLGAKVAFWLANIGESLCYEKVCMSGHLQSRGYKYVPHPLYKTSFKYSSIRSDAISSHEYFVVFGEVSPHKNLHNLISIWTTNTLLVVVGNCKDNKYLDLLKQMSVGKKVQFYVGYIGNEEAFRIVSQSSGVILSRIHSANIVSGAYFYAVTHGVPVFAIRTEFFDWLTESGGVPGLYLYHDLVELTNSLETRLHQTLNKTSIAQFGYQRFSIETVALAWRDVLVFNK